MIKKASLSLTLFAVVCLKSTCTCCMSFGIISNQYHRFTINNQKNIRYQLINQLIIAALLTTCNYHYRLSSIIIKIYLGHQSHELVHVQLQHLMHHTWNTLTKKVNASWIWANDVIINVVLSVFNTVYALKEQW